MQGALVIRGRQVAPEHVMAPLLASLTGAARSCRLMPCCRFTRAHGAPPKDCSGIKGTSVFPCNT